MPGRGFIITVGPGRSAYVCTSQPTVEPTTPIKPTKQPTHHLGTHPPTPKPPTGTHARTHRKSFPSNLLQRVKTTVLAGMLIPMEKVSVAKRHFRRPSCQSVSQCP